MEHADLHNASGGRLYAAFYFEIVERSEYADAVAFHKAVASAEIEDETVDHGKATHLTLSYTRPDHILGVEIDLKPFDLKRRWTETGDLGYRSSHRSPARTARVVSKSVMRR